MDWKKPPKLHVLEPNTTKRPNAPILSTSHKRKQINSIHKWQKSVIIKSGRLIRKLFFKIVDGLQDLSSDTKIQFLPD